MAVNPMLSSGITALDRSRSQLDEAAHKLASAGAASAVPVDTDPAIEPLAQEKAASGAPDQAEALASMTVYARQVQAAAKVIETADATIGFLLDTRA